MAEELGTTFAGRYTLVRHLATGGMAELYLARLGSLGGFVKEVVIKRIHPRYADHGKVTKLFLDEARIAATLSHPNILNVLDVGEEGGALYIVMEYIRGENLWAVARRGVEAHSFLPLPMAVRVVASICEGLHYVHTRRGPDGRSLEIVHRDVSPSNIVVSADGVAKLVDFGIARWSLRSFDDRSLVTGKPNYMAPEQLRGEVVDPRADVFALGIVLWEMTVQKRLFRGKTDEVTRRILEEPIPAPSTAAKGDYPPELERIVMRALEKRPEDRYQSCAELHEDLEALVLERGMRASTIAIGKYVRELFAMKTSPSIADLEEASTWGEEERDDHVEDLDFDRVKAESELLGGGSGKVPRLEGGERSPRPRSATPPPVPPAAPAAVERKLTPVPPPPHPARKSNPPPERRSNPPPAGRASRPPLDARRPVPMQQHEPQRRPLAIAFVAVVAVLGTIVFLVTR